MEYVAVQLWSSWSRGWVGRRGGESWHKASSACSGDVAFQGEEPRERRETACRT